MSRNRWGECVRHLKGRVRALRPGSHGYLHAWLSRDGKVKPYYVHRLVGEAFLGPLPPGLETRHGPGGKTDNRLSNLCYGTASENQLDRARDGTANKGGPAGEAHHSARLTDAIVAACRFRHAAGESQMALAREFGVTVQAMHNAIRHKTWRHLP